MCEYAIKIADQGHDVYVYSSNWTEYINKGSKWIKYYRTRLLKRYIPTWLEKTDNVTWITVPSIEDKYIRNADIVISTWWQTAFDTHLLSNSKGKKINLIQDYENFVGHIDLLHKSYDLPYTKNIVTYQELGNQISEFTSKKNICVPYGINTKKFQIRISLKDRNPFSICMLFSLQKRKNSYIGIEAVLELKKKYPKISFCLYSLHPRPKNLPKWIDFIHQPKDVSEIFNASAIFLQNSTQEGLPLNILEAQACGCAIVCSDIQGHKSVCENNINSLIYPVNNRELLITRISELIENKNLRIKIGNKASEDVATHYNWDNAVTKMLKEFLI